MNREFHERFNIEVPLEEVRRRFVNRVYSQIFGRLNRFVESPPAHSLLSTEACVANEIAYRLGETEGFPLDEYIHCDFHRTLQAIETVNDLPGRSRSDLEKTVHTLLNHAEVDLGVRWQHGRFIPSGAKLLDEELVDAPLKWLADAKYQDVLKAFQKGLEHLLRSQKNSKLREDVVTDMYEALEALAKIATGRKDKDLSANMESFIKEVRVSQEYKVLLKNYIDYACRFRHAPSEKKPRPDPSAKETESFVYLTGLFIRLAMPEPE